MTDETLMTTGQESTDAGTQQEAPASTEGTTPPADEGASTQQQAPDATDTQTADTQPEGDQDQGDAGDQAPEGAPEKYEFEGPEGSALDDQVIGKFSEVAKELNLSQDAAQKILSSVAPVIQARQAEAIQEARNAWLSDAKADQEFGGEKLAENLSVAKKALDAFGTPELRSLLNETGLGNHPEMIRVLFRAGKAISEDRFVPAQGSGGPTGGKDFAKSLYPEQQR